MKKILSFLAILTAGLLSSACINTFAVHELNQIAAEYVNKGDLESAISRLEASVDLDENVYETRYNLAIAYLKADKCDKALNQIEAASKLAKQKDPVIYYTLGVANSCLAHKISNDTDDIDEKTLFNEMSKDELNEKYITYLEAASENYSKYVKLSPNAADIDNVNLQIEQINEKINDLKGLQ